ncbi:MAG: serine/threonine protein kinase [Frankiales bacterium]|nr:serine/threonine protein kinase [Frankiales bacterium]
MTRAGLLGERYRLGEVIGRGGMAEVRHGTDIRLGRDVAVKLLRDDLARDPLFRARFRREAQSAASLDAPTVVAVYDTGEDTRGAPWIVMEYVDGRTLRDILTTEGRLLPERALEVTADVCSALDVAHTSGMVHRDIKPANVMLTSRGEVKVMDFGIAQAATASESTMTQTAAVIGTAAYLSPEQARGEHVDARSDIYSAGCLLYELVTGVPPFVGDSPVAVAYQHVRENPVPPSEYDPALPPEMAATLDAVILKAMAKNPANRYQSADEMREDLLRALAGQPVQATPVLVESEGAGAARRDALSRWPTSGRYGYALYGFVLVLAALLSGLLVHALLGNDNNLIKPPSVIGLSQSEAVRTLALEGLRVDKVSGVFSTEREVGTVIAQSPDADFFVRKNGSVDLTVSRGPELVQVPAVVGMSQREAEADLTAVKLKLKVVTRDGNIPVGTVLDMLPRSGSQVNAGTEVSLIVASGKVQVPDVRGRTIEEAVSILGQAGFGTGLRYVDSNETPGRVVAEEPVNVLAPRGSDVIVDVAQTPGSAPPTQPDPSATP